MQTMTKKKDPKDLLPRGRPTVYKDEFCDQLIEFFNIEPYEEKLIPDRSGGKKREVVPCKFPTLARFSCIIGVTRETLHDWATSKLPNGELKHPEFSYSYKRAKEYQESLLVEGAMAGAFNPAFAIFTAKNILGWRDRQEIENSGVVEVNYHGGLRKKTAESLTALNEI